jgi:hypothetical protein
MDMIRTYVSAFKLWYCMQILTIPEEASTRQINSLVAWFNGQDKYSGYPSRLCIYRRRKEMRRSSTYRRNAMCSFSVDAGNNCKPKTSWPLDGSNSGNYISTSINHRTWELFPHDFRENRSGRTSIMFLSMAQPAPHAIAWYMTLYRHRSARFKSIASPLLNVPTATHPAPYFIHSLNAKKLLTYGAGQGADWPSSSVQTSVTSLPPRHVAAFSQYVNMAQTQTRSHLMGCRSHELFC